MLSDEIVEAIADGSADISIVAGTVDTGALPSLPLRPLRPDRAARTRAGRPRQVAFGEVLDEDFVGLDRSSALQRFLARQALVAGKPIRLRVQLRRLRRHVPAGAGRRGREHRSESTARTA